MKKIIILGVLLLMSTLYVKSQVVNIETIPYPMTFENTPKSYKIISKDAIDIESGSNADLFISPSGDYSINKSPRLLFKPTSDFILSAKISLDFNTKWDAGDLIIYNDEKHFAKFCFEKDYKGQQRVVSVVCNDVADDCNSMPIQGNDVYYRIIGSSKGNAFYLYTSNDGKEWMVVRNFRLQKNDNIRIGFSAQSPVGNGCMVHFSNISLEQRKPVDSWKGY